MLSDSDLFFGCSVTWTRIYREIQALALSDLPLVLLGPTGSGKSVLARHIHALSRRQGAFVEHSIGSVPDSLSYSALVGHARGAYTGAVDRHVGALESAKGGTLFLDELGLATPTMQHLLLGLLEGRPFTPLGASRTVSVDLRFLFATNAEPETLLADGRWKPDLYYRLGGNLIRLPALASRSTDTIPLALHFLRKRLRAMGRTWNPSIEPEVEAIFLKHPWPGNIRQLQSVCDRAAVLLQSERPVEIGDLAESFLGELSPGSTDALRQADIARVHQAILRHRGNKAAAARELGMHRNDLYRFLERFPESIRQTLAQLA